MRLSERQKHILFEAELQAARSIPELAEAVGIRAHAVRYELQKLSSLEVVVKRSPFIDLYRLGFIPYTIYFSFAGSSKEQEHEILVKLMSSPLVIWLIELGGEFQYGLSICARNMLEVIRLLNRIALRFGNVFFNKSVNVRTAYTYFGRRYLWPEKARHFFHRAAMTDDHVRVDETDMQLLAGLSADSLTSLRSLAAKLHIPQTTFERRKARLETTGVIPAYHYRMSPEKMGMQSYKLLIYLKGLHPRLSQRIIEVAFESPWTLYCIECMGTWDYELGIEVEKASEVTAVTRLFYDRLGSEISTIKIAPVFRYHKYSNFPASVRLSSATQSLDDH